MGENSVSAAELAARLRRTWISCSPRAPDGADPGHDDRRETTAGDFFGDALTRNRRDTELPRDRCAILVGNDCKMQAQPSVVARRREREAKLTRSQTDAKPN
jgi:hypothetical protein